MGNVLQCDRPDNVTNHVTAAEFTKSVQGAVPVAENGVAQTHPTGGEQAANTLQPTSTSQHRTTPDAKVRSAITPSPRDGRACVHPAEVIAPDGFFFGKGPFW